MALNRVTNPRKLDRLAARIGEPVERAYAKFFRDHVLLVFGASGRQYAVSKDAVEPYAQDPPLVLVEGGITSAGGPLGVAVGRALETVRRAGNGPRSPEESA